MRVKDFNRQLAEIAHKGSDDIFIKEENGDIANIEGFGIQNGYVYINTFKDISEEEAKVDRKKAEEDELAHIKMIISIADRILETTDKKELLKMGERGYYERVLEQYKDVCKYPFSL